MIKRSGSIWRPPYNYRYTPGVVPTPADEWKIVQTHKTGDGVNGLTAVTSRADEGLSLCLGVAPSALHPLLPSRYDTCFNVRPKTTNLKTMGGLINRH